MKTNRLDSLAQRLPEFVSFLERRVGSRAVAEDLVQEAFLRGLDHLEGIQSDESARAWFYRVLRNAAIDHFRRRGASERALEKVAREFEDAVQPDAEMDDAVCQCVKKLAERLKPEYADAIRRVEVEGASVKDFAEEASITPNNAGVRLHRAREALRRSVFTSCGKCAENGCTDCTCGSM